MRRRVRRVAIWVVVGAAAVAGLYALSRESYLLFHATVEIFSICVAVATFMIAWNVRDYQQNGYLGFLGVAYLFVAAIDFVHTLAYKGMGVLPVVGSNAATQLWVQARYLEALSLLAAPAFLRRRPRLLSEGTFAACAVATTLLVLTVFVWRVFPTSYVEGVGLTLFKKASEYAISFLLVVALALLLRHRERFDRRVMAWLATSIALTIGSELSFTLYVDVYGVANLVGHLFKAASFYLIYRAIVETGLRDPYAFLLRDLKSSEAALRDTNSELEVRVAERTTELAGANSRLRVSLEKEQRTEEGLRRLNLILEAIRGVNQLIVREKDKNRLLEQTSSLLVRTRGYEAAWIILTDDAGKPCAYAESEPWDHFGRFLEKLTDGEPPACCRRAWQAPGPAVADSFEGCATCKLKAPAPSCRRMITRLECAGHRYGLLGVTLPGEVTADEDEKSLVSETAGDIAYALRNIDLEEARRQAVEALRGSLEGTIATIATMGEARDPYTAGHQRRMTQLAVAIARELGLADDRIEGLRVACLLHDIGKIALPAEILSKPGRLTETEMNLVRAHPETAYQILRSVPFPWPVAEHILNHHERLDGSGYPKGLSGDAIPLEPRIMAVADVVEAMSSHRPYRAALGIERALSEIEGHSGTRYDRSVVEACVALLRQGTFAFPA